MRSIRASTTCPPRGIRPHASPCIGLFGSSKGARHSSQITGTPSISFELSWSLLGGWQAHSTATRWPARFFGLLTLLARSGLRISYPGRPEQTITPPDGLVKTQQVPNPIPALKVSDVNLTAHSRQNIICDACRSSATCRSLVSGRLV